MSDKQQRPGTPPAEIDFEAAVDDHYEDLYRFALSLTARPADAADLTQETYRILMQKAHQVREPHKIKSWLFTTLHREWLRRGRRRRRFPEVQLEAAGADQLVCPARQREGMDSQLVLAALQKLDEKFRAPVVMFYLDALSYKEIAEVLDLPLGTVMSRLARGKAMLRRLLEEAPGLSQSVEPSDARPDVLTNASEAAGLSGADPLGQPCRATPSSPGCLCGLALTPAAI